MKVAFTANDEHLFAQIEPVFERSRFFIIIDPENRQRYECIYNPFYDRSDASGDLAALYLISKNVNVLYTGSCGEQAASHFKKTGITVREGFSGSILIALDKLKISELMSLKTSERRRISGHSQFSKIQNGD